MIPTRTLGKPFFLNLPRFYHEASRLHFLQLLANTVAGRWGTSLDVLWSETLMWWNSNLEHYDVKGGISRNEWNRSESLYEQKKVLQAMFFGHIDCQVLTSTSLHTEFRPLSSTYCNKVIPFTNQAFLSHQSNDPPQLVGTKEPLEGLRTAQAFLATYEPHAHCQSVLAEWCP